MDLDELEHMALNAVYEQSDDETSALIDPSQRTIKMWQERFGYSYEKAAELIGITKTIQKPSIAKELTLSPLQARAIYALKLKGPLDTPEKVRVAAGLSIIPEAKQGTAEGGDAIFCKINRKSRVAIQQWIFKQKDATLPQYRPQDAHLLENAVSFDPAQHQYSVWYFFYGTLADVSKLSSLLSLPKDAIPIFHPAAIKGGKIRTWGAGKYNALIDGPETAYIRGSAYQVMSQEHEDSLRRYETHNYEVVRCTILTDFSEVKGCTFRFIGALD